MRWELFEVWSVSSDDHEELVDTTKSLKEARELAKQALTSGAVEAIIYREVNEELEEFERLTE
jgi:predicted RNase H-like HicB family nuclease